MAKVRLNPVIQGLHGRIGGMIFRGAANGETIVYLAPGKSDGGTKVARSPHLKEAHTYARTAMDDPEMRSYYEQEAKRMGRKPYLVAYCNYFKIKKKLGE